ncbi:hypothetical protein ZIOFF_000021 [Zingiber officinale]|uniref:Desiccation-related protein PCC13-62 n=1 Tax=Zingiber officinale TaxID=94328 RepID=A0A8J5M785_ZINOF|nr:hypothetical protein ZIOFF_000021 [Zingiber officinale]
MAGGGKDPDMCAPPPTIGLPVYPGEKDLFQFAQNFEFLEGEFFMFGALGYGYDTVAPGMAVKNEFGGIPRPLLNLSDGVFADIMNDAFGYNLNPPFDPYNDTLKYLIAAYVIPYVGVVTAVGANPSVRGYESKRLLAGLLAVEAGQDAIIRTLLYERKYELVPPYNITVAEFTIKISELRNRLAMCGVKDEGLIVPMPLGAEGKLTTNILSADNDSLAYQRTPNEALRVLYLTGSECQPGGFFPQGANGKIAKEFLISPC